MRERCKFPGKGWEKDALAARESGMVNSEQSYTHFGMELQMKPQTPTTMDADAEWYDADDGFVGRMSCLTCALYSRYMSPTRCRGMGVCQSSLVPLKLLVRKPSASPKSQNLPSSLSMMNRSAFCPSTP
jgi:hypothetical protein